MPWVVFIILYHRNRHWILCNNLHIFRLGYRIMIANIIAPVNMKHSKHETCVLVKICQKVHDLANMHNLVFHSSSVHLNAKTLTFKSKFLVQMFPSYVAFDGKTEFCVRIILSTSSSILTYVGISTFIKLCTPPQRWAI